MNDLQIFSYEGKEIRTVQVNGETFWVLKDACDVLELADTNKVAERLDNDDLTRIKIVSGGQAREMYAVNESGLYDVILRSDKPEAKKFKRWVTHDVLPSIRKTGTYISESALDTSKLSANMQLLLQMANSMAAQELRQAELEGQISETSARVDTVESSLTAIRDTIIQRDGDWRKSLNTMFNNAVKASGSNDYQAIRHETYDILESRAHCDLDRRLRYMRDRLADQGATRSKINALTKIDVIEQDPKLREIYTSIVKEFSVRYVNQ